MHPSFASVEEEARKPVLAFHCTSNRDDSFSNFNRALRTQSKRDYYRASFAISPMRRALDWPSEWNSQIAWLEIVRSRRGGARLLAP